MAKSKEFEEKYKAIRLASTVRRKAERRAFKKANDKYKTMECNSCGGRMTWCSCCGVWTQLCCEKYGTCMCS